MKSQDIKIGGILQKHHLVKISIMAVPDRPGVAGVLLGALGAEGINCPFVVHTIDRNSLDTLVLCVTQQDQAAALRALEGAKTEVGAQEVVCHGDVGMVSIFGPHFGERAGIAGAMFSALAAAGINILTISTSISSLSCVIAEADMDRAVAALQSGFAQP